MRTVLLWLTVALGMPAALVGVAQTPLLARQTQENASLAQQPGDLLDINTASAAQLRALPGMGDVYVRRVMEGRPYFAKNQLVTRGVLPQGEYQRIRDLVVAHRPAKIH